MFFKRKQCKQCGWELKLFTRHEFCSGSCVTTYVNDKKEREEYEALKTRGGI